MQKKLAASLILGLLACLPLLYFCWSKWKFILGFIFVVSILIVVVWVAKKIKQKKKCKDDKDNENTPNPLAQASSETQTNLEEKLNGILSQIN